MTVKVQQIDSCRWRIPREGAMRTDGLIFASPQMMQDLRREQALEQVCNVATLPGIVGPSMAMPDIHWGYGFPIGGVAAFDLIEWERQMGVSLAFVSSHLPADEMLTRLLDPIIEQPDDICMPILAPFTNFLVCLSIIDAPQIEEHALVLLDACLDRTLQHRDFRRTGYREGEVSGFDLPVLIKALLLVAVDRADGAERFANGRWDELPNVLPLIDKMIKQIGWVPFVTQHFLTLCERAGEHYPANVFADQILAQIVDEHLPASWKGLILPARIAGLVQEFADRNHPLPLELARKLLHILDALVDLGDRRSAALQQSESFRGVLLSSAEL